MLIQSKGDITRATVDAIVHPANTVGLMGRGLGYQLKSLYPEMYEAYREACKRRQNPFQPGQVLTYSVSQGYDIIHLPIKVHYRDPASLVYIRSGLTALADLVVERGYRKVAFPYLRAGLGGVKWSEIRAAIVELLGPIPGLEISIWEDADDEGDATDAGVTTGSADV